MIACVSFRLSSSAVFCRFNFSHASAHCKMSQSWKEKKEKAKQALRAYRQEKKRNTESFAHYENSNVSDYYYDGIFRKVFPYYFTFKAYAKRRWLDRTIYDILQSEFSFISLDIIKMRCESGHILVNNNLVSPEYIVKDSDFICHRLHRHELPVLNLPINFVYHDNEILVINKPPSIPVHPCGQYTLNSIIHILAKEYDFRSLRFVHRLDRMTSGLVLIAKNYDASLRLASQISNREVKKYYICHTEGYFPDSVGSFADSAVDIEIKDAVIICKQPLGPICSKMGIHAVLPESKGGKDARTHFIRLSYDSESQTSLVLCRLFTGRTHQIRIHLQYLGYPIVEDPLYNSTDWGDMKGKGAQYGMSIEEVLSKLNHSCNSGNYIEDQIYDQSKRLYLDTDCTFHNSNLNDQVKARLKESVDPLCPDCQRKYKDPTMDRLVLRLHAYRYSGPDWCYSAPLPDWATSKQIPDLNQLIDESIEKL